MLLKRVREKLTTASVLTLLALGSANAAVTLVPAWHAHYTGINGLPMAVTTFSNGRVQVNTGATILWDDLALALLLKHGIDILVTQDGRIWAQGLKHGAKVVVVPTRHNRYVTFKDPRKIPKGRAGAWLNDGRRPVLPPKPRHDNRNKHHR